jgi:hypothetical protein
MTVWEGLIWLGSVKLSTIVWIFVAFAVAVVVGSFLEDNE